VVREGLTMYKSESQSDSVENLTKALLEVHKQHGVVIGKDSKSFRNTYATLPGILTQIKDMIAPHGLILTQGSEAEYGGSAIYTLLEHVESGEYRKTISKLFPKELPVLPDYIINKMDQGQWNAYCKALIDHNPDQAWGSSTTYHRRYDAMMICGFFSVDDPTDFNEGSKEILEDRPSTIQRTMNIIDPASSSSSNISDKQLALLHMKLKSNPGLEQSILAQQKIKSLSDIPRSNFNAILALFGPQ